MSETREYADLRDAEHAYIQAFTKWLSTKPDPESAKAGIARTTDVLAQIVAICLSPKWG